MELYYDQVDASLGNTPQYNGNISAMVWQSNPHGRFAYTFAYDGLNRLLNGNFHEQSESSWDQTDQYSEKELSYDKNGNILTLHRYGQILPTGAAGMIDDLNQFYYFGNQLIGLNDSQLAPTERDFQDNGSTEAANQNNLETWEYHYDPNGNMVIDKNKGILAIHYNHLNLPTEIIFQDNNRIKYFYDAAGTKRRKEVYTEGIKTSVQDYAGSVVYRDDAVSYAVFEEGRVLITPEEPNYIEYHLKDHLGNVRVAYKEDNGLPLALQTNTYYPFGMLISELSTPGINCPNPLKYNAKELQPDFGLDWYDYGARFYDPQVGRWWGVDPMADQRSWVSPYSYCQNSPMNRVDPTGALDDWYQSEAGNVVWREGDAETITVNGEEFKNIGTSYTTTVIGGDALIHYDQDKPTVIDLTTDVGKKYSMIAAEGGWIKQDGETKRETEYGLLLISASMENRLNNPKFFPNKGTYESLFTPSQYNAANSRTYKNIASQIPTWESWYGTADVMSYLYAVFKASHGSAVSTLQTDYKFANADKILGYAHNNSNLFGKYSINLGFDKTNTLIKTLQSSSVVFPTLK